MQTNLKRFIYVWALPVIFLALTSFLLAEKPALKIKNHKVEKGVVLITLTGPNIDDSKLEFKVGGMRIGKQNVENFADNCYKLIFPYELRNDRVNLDVYYDQNYIDSVPLLLPDDRKHLTITYDLMDLNDPLRDSKDEQYVVNYRKHVTFRVINANPLRYRVTLTGKNKNYFIESPKVYQDAVKEAMSMKVSEPVQKPSMNLSAVADELSHTAETEQLLNQKYLEAQRNKEAAEEDLNKEKENLNDLLKAISDAEDAKKKAVEELNEAKEKKKEAQAEVDRMETKINEETDTEKKDELKSKPEYIKAKDNVLEIQSLIDSFEKKGGILEQREKSITDAKNKFNDNNERLKKSIEEKDEARKRAIIAYENYNKEIKEKVEKLKSVKAFLEAYEKLSIIEDFYNHLVRLSLSNDSFDKIQKNIEPNLETILVKERNENFEYNLDSIVPKFTRWLMEAKEAYNEIDIDWFKKSENKLYDKFSLGDIQIIELCKERMDKTIEMDIIGKIQTLISVIRKPENFVQSITIPTVDSDEVHFTARIEALPNSVSTTDSVSKIIDPIVVKVSSGWAINFSTGVVFHYKAHDRSYRLERSSTQGSDLNSTTYTIEENENKNSITPSVAGLMHIYPRSVRSVKWGGLVFGIGTKDTEKFHYYLGTSLMLGSPRRFVVNFGIVITKIDFLKTEYTKGGSITLPTATDITKLTLVEKQFKAKLFFGFTYNLTTD
ncbi:MAG TPA: hypothetical protein VK469_09220 [Candidatus Kapabacteria bacterium]|nr:hypothetical protein [Candidatus Kapabacteria bacterium]